jgi:hypothetical protein
MNDVPATRGKVGWMKGRHRAALIAGLVMLLTGCAHASVAPGDLKPVGLTCGVGNVRADRSADSVFDSALAALAAMHVAPLSDSAEGHLLVSGANAPRGKGSAEMRKARMYLDFRVVAAAGDSAASTYSVAPGLSVQPSGLGTDDGWALYKQADEFAAEFMARAGLPWGSCFGEKGRDG